MNTVLHSLLNIPKKVIITSPYISATEFDNFMNNDILCDWLSIVLPKKVDPHPLQHLFTKGNHHEAVVIDTLRKKLKVPLDKKSSLTTSREYTDYFHQLDLQTTINEFKKGTPIIYSPFIASEKEDLRGIPDLLVRSDYMNTYFGIDVPQEDSVFGSYYYLPIEIKYSQLYFNKSGCTLLNMNRTKIYKMQLCVYSKILSDIQGTFPCCGFIIGKDINAKLGHVYFQTDDNEIVTLFYQGLEWLRDVKKNATKWKDDDLIPKLLPNMKVSHPIYDKEKKIIATHFNEITEFWQCGVKQRLNLIDHSIYSWKDEKFDVSLLKVHQKSYEDKLDKIFKVNRGEINPIYPKRITHDLYEWRNDCDEIYVDFETVGDELENEETMIYLIGVYHEKHYTYFIADSISHDSEKKLILSFYQFWVDLNQPKIWYWYAENTFWNKVCKKYNLTLDMTWADLYKVFFNGNVVVKGCKNFKLKSYVHALVNLRKIRIVLPPEECCNGLDALFLGLQYYSERDGAILNNILAYNEFDCKSLYVLLQFIRNEM